MLPTPTNVRSRYTKQYKEKGMANLERAVHDSALKFKNLPTRAKFLFGSSLVVSVLFYGFIIRSFFKNDLMDEHFLETDKCPACYGMSACGQFFYDRVKFTGWSKLRFLDRVNIKNVHFADHQDLNSVVIKKLSHDSEIQAIDDKICSDGNRPAGCDIARVIYITNTAQTLKKGPIQPETLKGEASMFTCGSYRLLDRLWHYYKERLKKKEIFFRDKIQLWYISMVNTEPLMLQTFPASEGWPFPEYYGACGRFMMVEDTGRPLGDFFHASFEKRADIAYQIMKIADKMTINEEQFALYWTDLTYENLSVDAAGKVKVIDLENIIVVDLMAIAATKPKGWDEFLESPFDECGGKNCLGFSTAKLCSHVNSDHNYYAACRNILSQYANEDGKPGGLLHDMPDHARDYWDLEHLLNECARPQTVQGRIKVKDKLISAFENLMSDPNVDVNVLDEAMEDKHENRFFKKTGKDEE
ncbi:divergent protein kinase domain 2A-like [Haliotis rufescens]|uniref:divergent protein kinase domain 2A-like n=1 Tax=Haliotis rufescens TaxID=6454 RepID=UPI00201F12BA|nr:divergent protein kinase domain 2A-like [Haliotis rufescens]